MKGRVLIVDDDPQILEVLDIGLANLGLDVTAIGNPGDAIRIAKAVHFDAALVDLRMGPPDGILLTEALHGRRSWAYSTVKTLLDRMVEKGLVQARQVGNVWEYTPALPRQKAQRWAWRRLVDVAFGGAIAPTLAFVARDTKLSRRDRAELRALLEQLEKQDGGSEEGDND